MTARRSQSHVQSAFHIRSTFHIRLDTVQDLADPGLVHEVLGTLAKLFPEAFPHRWGDLEPLRIRATSEQFEEVVQFASTTSLWAYGQLPKSKTSMRIDPGIAAQGRLSRLFMTIDRKTVDIARPDNRERICQLFEKWCLLLDAQFGRCCLEEERWRKNVIDVFHEPDGTITSPKVFDADIRTGLPGVYWTTYFGREYVDWFGSRKFSSAVPWPVSTKCGDGYLLRRSHNPNAWEIEAELDIRLIGHLGRERFFDIAEPFRRVDLLPKYEQFRHAREVAARANAHSEADEASGNSSKDDVERLLGDGMPFVQQLLTKHGEFLPVGLALSSAGEISNVAVADADDPSVKCAYEELETILRGGLNSRRYRAFAILSNVRVKRPRFEDSVDAVEAQCEHVSGYAVTVYTPYSVGAEGAVKFGESWAV